MQNVSHIHSPRNLELPGIHTQRRAPLCLQCWVYNIQSQKILDILIWAVRILIWGELSASACPRHLIISASTQTHVSLLKPLRGGTFVRLASTFWQAALWISASPPGRCSGSAGSPLPANSHSMRRGHGGSWVKWAGEVSVSVKIIIKNGWTHKNPV